MAKDGDINFCNLWSGANRIYRLWNLQVECLEAFHNPNSGPNGLPQQ